MRIVKSLIFSIALLAVFSNTALAFYSLGKPTGFVNDYTNTLTAQEKQNLENKLSNFEKETSNEISIAIIPSLKEDNIENFAVKLFEEWGIGKKGEDNGVLVLVAMEDRKMRIEVGYGLEGDLTDAQSYWIINNEMKPAFREGKFYEGLDSATNKIIDATKGVEIPSDKESKSYSAMDLFWVLSFVFLWVSSILARSKSWWLGGVFGAIAGVIIGFVKYSLIIGGVATGILIPIGLLFDYFVSKKYIKSKAAGHIPWYIGGGRGGRGGGSGFSGFGGGMSGGGGSSGSW